MCGAVDRLATAWRISAKYSNELVPIAERNFQLTREAYAAGQISFIVVLEAQRSFLSIRGRLSDTVHDTAKTIPELERAVGLPIAEILSLAGSTVPAPDGSR